MQRLSSVFALLVVACAHGQSIKLPATKQTPVNIPCIIAPTENTGGVVKWLLPDPGVKEVLLTDLFPPEIADKAIGRIFYASQPGKYRIWAVVAKGDKVSDRAECLLQVGDSPAPPTPPEPVPPTPPAPPTDPLTQAVGAAFVRDGSPAAQVKALASVYRLASTTTVNDPKVTTLDQLVAIMHKAADAMLPPPATGPRPLQNVRDELKADLGKATGTKPGTPMDAALRKTCGDQFARYATILEGLSSGK